MAPIPSPPVPTPAEAFRSALPALLVPTVVVGGLLVSRGGVGALLVVALLIWFVITRLWRGEPGAGRAGTTGAAGPP